MVSEAADNDDEKEYRLPIEHLLASRLFLEALADMAALSTQEI